MDVILFLFLFLFHHLIVSRTFYSLNSSYMVNIPVHSKRVHKPFSFAHVFFFFSQSLLSFFSYQLFLFQFRWPAISIYFSIFSFFSLVHFCILNFHLLKFIMFPDCFWNSSAHNSCDHLKTNFESKMCCRTHENRIDGRIIHL